jgi:hypothetical protein
MKNTECYLKKNLYFSRFLKSQQNQIVTDNQKMVGFVVILKLSHCCNYFFVRYTPVHCRTGSLERAYQYQKGPKFVHCRTGSLEIVSSFELPPSNVHCRTGSLESNVMQEIASRSVHCRTGSLEITVGDDSKLVQVHCRTGSLEIRIQTK